MVLPGWGCAYMMDTVSHPVHHIFKCEHECACVCAQACGGERSASGIGSQAFPTSLFEICISLAWNSQIQLDCLGFSRLSLLNTKITGPHH